jgi:ribonuclease HII
VRQRSGLRATSLLVLRERLRAGTRLPPGTLRALRDDGRSGAHDLLQWILARQQANRAESRRLQRLCIFERSAQVEGFALVAGVDEAGMAPLAGPVVAAAALLPRNFRPRGLDDSKKLDAPTRERLAGEVKQAAVAWAIGLAAVEEIDRLNIYHAGLLAMRRAVQGLSVIPDLLLVDARRIPALPIPQRPLIHGDALSISIAAASVLAKTHRDALMQQLDAEHPGYGLAQHKGYPTPEHLAALRRLGPSAIHRRSFEPVRALLPDRPLQRDLFRQVNLESRR